MEFIGEKGEFGMRCVDGMDGGVIRDGPEKYGRAY